MSPDTKHAPIRDMRAARLPGWVFSATAALLAVSAKCAPVEVAVPVPSSGESYFSYTSVCVW